MTDHVVVVDVESCTSTMADLSTAAVTQRRVRFGPISEAVYDGSLSQVERDLLWHDPDELREQARKEIQRARKVWRQNRGGLASTAAGGDPFCLRGLEKRLRSSDSLRKKWLTFLQSFLALQQDLRKLDTDVSNLIMVFVSTHSKADKVNAQQVALQDEATAFSIHFEQQPDSHMRRGSGKKLHLSSTTASEQPQQRSSTSCRRARSA
jgi:hypothetical protein